MKVNSLESWIGHSQQEQDVVAASQAHRLAALLDHSVSTLRNGEEIPAHWYQILFGSLALQAALAADGHPSKGDFLPPVLLPRRMFAGRSVRFFAALRIGQAVTRTSTIHAITPKMGRSGEMCFVTVRNRITNEADQLLIEEDQDIVYRGDEAPQTVVTMVKDVSSPPHLPSLTHELLWTPCETELFRYSAITFNAHRIHYDLPYASDVEGYPGLVVNGGLTTMKLWDLAVQRLNRPIVSSRSRNLRPLFAGHLVKLRLAQTSETQAIAWAEDVQGQTAARIELQLGDSL